VLQTVSLDDEMSSGENVISRWTGRVTHQGALIGIPPIGNRIDVTTLGIWRVRDGKISEAWIVFDAPGMTQQLGVASLP
jgi:predicted ester cyclase